MAVEWIQTDARVGVGVGVCVRQMHATLLPIPVIPGSTPPPHPASLTPYIISLTTASYNPTPLPTTHAHQPPIHLLPKSAHPYPHPPPRRPPHPSLTVDGLTIHSDAALRSLALRRGAVLDDRPAALKDFRALFASGRGLGGHIAVNKGGVGNGGHFGRGRK